MSRYETNNFDNKDICCGTCQYCKCVGKPNTKSSMWICDNPDSDYYGLDTAYDDACDDYEGR